VDCNPVAGVAVREILPRGDWGGPATPLFVASGDPPAVRRRPNLYDLPEDPEATVIE
jgi:hypothetical protein